MMMMVMTSIYDDGDDDAPQYLMAIEHGDKRGSTCAVLTTVPPVYKNEQRGSTAVH